RSDVPSRDLGRDTPRRDPLELGPLEPDADRSVQDGRPGRERPGGPDRTVHPVETLEVAWEREALPDHARFEADDRVAGLDGRPDVVGDEERHGSAPSGQVCGLAAT